MPQVDFYILSERHSSERFLCQLTNKIWQQGHKVYIHTNHQEQAKQLNERLWTYSDISFLPHGLSDSSENSETPVTIGWDKNANDEQDVLINLNHTVPEFTGDFSRIVEIVGSDETTKQNARAHFREYRERGYELESHNIE